MADAQTNAPEFSVSEISFSIKKTMEDAFGYVRVRGELGRISRPGSGHIYLDLKDDRSVLSGVIWKGVASRLKIQPEQGLEVIASGKVTTFPGQSKYQMVIDSLEPAGAGALMALLEERKRKLDAEGLFAPERKQLLPSLPTVIGVVTSPSGAVIRDILHRISDRFPLHVLVWPVRVQGETCAAEVANGIRGFNALNSTSGPFPKPDVMIVARGGGSIEDLWGFNEEAVVRAAAESNIPLISAVGHETDWTLLDLVADVRAPTPTGAAEIAVPVKADLMAMVDDRSRRLASSLIRLISTRRTELRAASAALPAAHELLALPRQRFDTFAARLEHALQVNARAHRSTYQSAAARLTPLLLSRTLATARDRLEALSDRQKRALGSGLAQKRVAATSIFTRLAPDRLHQKIKLGDERLATQNVRLELAYKARLSKTRDRLDGLEKLLKSLSYKDVLSRGYALVRDEEGQPVRSSQSVETGSQLSIELADGSIEAITRATEATDRPPQAREIKGKKTKSKPASAPPSGQGNLF